MTNCSDFIQSQNTLEFVVALNEQDRPKPEPGCVLQITDRYAIYYYNKNELSPLSVANYSYGGIPKCLGLLNTESLEVSGILRLQNQSTLSLKGQGVFVAVIDTGIQYTDAAFRTPDGKTRIHAIWDQEAKGNSDEVQYGAVYKREEIDRALQSDAPLAIVPQQDEVGHGTFLASVACGTEDLPAQFVGAAPESELLVVKLKPAKQTLKDFFWIPEGTVAYAETDIMAAVAFCDRVADEADKPLVIFLGLGSNNGNHSGSSVFCQYLDEIAQKRHRAVVVANGNEAANRHHFFGQIRQMLQPVQVEISVENDMEGAYAEVWALAPEQVSVAVQSPTGEIQPKGTPPVLGSGSYRFLFEETELEIDYRNAGAARRDQLIFLRFSKLKKGIWTLRVYPQNIVTGSFHIWLPMRGMLESDCFFLQSNPDNTLTTPSDALGPMSVGGYRAGDGAIFFESGRGFDTSGMVKPDFVAPAVDVTGKDRRGNYTTGTGTSVAAALTAGACAQLMEWAVVKKNAVGIDSVSMKNQLIRGATRDAEVQYPSVSFGHGKLDIYQALLIMR